MSPNSTNASIPVYRSDGTIYAAISESRLGEWEAEGRIARLVRDRHGNLKRAILFASPHDPTPPHPGTYQGTRYSYLEKLENAPPCWRLKRLDLIDEDGVAIDAPSAFLQVVRDCGAR